MIVGANPSARIQVRGVAQLQAPGCCAICGSADAERRYVDVDVFEDFQGQYYFCNICMEESAGTLGCLTRDESLFLIEQNNKFEARSKELEKVKVEYDRLITALRSIGNGIADNLGLTDSSDLISETPAREQHGDKLTNDESTIDGTSEWAESIKSVAERPESVGTSRPTGSNRDNSGNIRL